jgi:hypothetical protein
VEIVNKILFHESNNLPETEEFKKKFDELRAEHYKP